MPTPLGHALAGLGTGWLVSRPPHDRHALWNQVAFFSFVAAAPDLDLLFGQHRGISHSVGMAAVVASLAAWRQWPVARSRARIWIAIFLCWCTHPFLDTLAYDNSPPQGVMAFWPFSHTYVQTGWSVFEPVWRNFWLRRTFRHDVWAATRELALLVPFTAAVWWARNPFRSARASR